MREVLNAARKAGKIEVSSCRTEILAAAPAVDAPGAGRINELRLRRSTDPQPGRHTRQERLK